MERLLRPRAAAAMLAAVLAGCGGVERSANAYASGAAVSAAGISRATACRTLDDSKDAGFNELAGISKNGRIAGYDGLGEGYVIRPPYRAMDFRYLKYPGGETTSATAANDEHSVVGFYGARGLVRGFLDVRGTWTSFGGPATVYEILGLNDRDEVVGFFTDKHGVDRAFGPMGRIEPPGSAGAVAAGIDDRDDVVGFFTTPNGSTEGFLLKNGAYREFLYPGSIASEALSMNASDDIVGEYTDASGATHGFVVAQLTTSPKWTSFDMLGASGLTVISGINDRGTFVGYYRDGAGNTDGFLCS